MIATVADSEQIESEFNFNQARNSPLFVVIQEYILHTKETVLSSLREVFKYESWNTKFEANLFVILVLTLFVEVIVIAIVWRKYGEKIQTFKHKRAEDKGKMMVSD